MNKVIKEKWVKALRSGEYKQGVGSLKTKRGNYCCLGVLCDIYSIEKKKDFDKVTETNKETLPVQVMKWAGLREDNPVVYGGDESLADLNDDGKSFKKISEIIENEL